MAGLFSSCPLTTW